MKSYRYFILFFLALLGGCSTVTMNPEVSGKLASQPDYQETKHFFLWGLAGEHRVDVKEVCGAESVAQMQTQQTFLNGLVGGLTLGIYAPHSVKVWCS